tara:strand:- start:44 stop:472 length:429 start_codon:yes stop_codon:yes gene_type:complete
MIRDPLSVIPSGLSLVTGVLDKKFDFWSLESNTRKKFINRLYLALVELLKRFHKDWVDNKINREKVMIIRFDFMMNDFDSLMDEIIDFLNIQRNDQLLKNIQDTARKQREYQSNHKYDLKKFGLSEAQIKNDCKEIYQTFLT